VSAPDERPRERSARAEEDRHRGEGAVLGVRVIRNSGVQGTAMAGAALLQLVNLFVVAHFLGAAELGRFALLFFGASLLAQLLSIAVKPGTLRRTFGGGDEEDDDDDDDEDVGGSPRRSLGTGLLLAAGLAAAGTAAAIALRAPIADLLLGTRDDTDLIVWAALLGGVTVLSRLTSIVVWFERRPTAFLICELSRPVLTLVATTALLAGGAGLKAVLIAATLGSLAAAIVGLIILRHSFEPVVEGSEAGAILHRGLLRGPIMLSYWTFANADVFLLSRAVSDADLGVYTLASRIGLIAAFAPQAFRVALRPLRKAAIFRSVEEQYGRREQRGQLLGYFLILCISAVLAMILLSEVVVEIAPNEFTDVAPLIPLTALGMMGPAVIRTVSQQTSWPGRTRATSIACAAGAAALFIAVTLLLGPELGVYAAPVGMVAGMVPPVAYLLVRCQLGEDAIAVPYREVGTALALAAAVGGVYALLPSMSLGLEAVAAVALGAAYLLLLPVLRVFPESHWEALLHISGSLVSGRPDRFQPRRGLRALGQDERDGLRAAVAASWATRSRRTRPDSVPPGAESAALVGALRRAADRGGVQVGQPTPLDAEIGAYLFSSEPTAVRNAAMRRLLGNGADAAELRALEDLVSHLATVPDDAWAGRRKYAAKTRA
jgi:O-antigen/teichoic acid export membrane protein